MKLLKISLAKWNIIILALLSYKLDIILLFSSIPSLHSISVASLLSLYTRDQVLFRANPDLTLRARQATVHVTIRRSAHCRNSGLRSVSGTLWPSAVSLDIGSGSPDLYSSDLHLEYTRYVATDQPGIPTLTLASPQPHPSSPAFIVRLSTTSPLLTYTSPI
jgi:hypothetical protein